MKKIWHHLCWIKWWVSWSLLTTAGVRDWTPAPGEGGVSQAAWGQRPYWAIINPRIFLKSHILRRWCHHLFSITQRVSDSLVGMEIACQHKRKLHFSQNWPTLISQIINYFLLVLPLLWMSINNSRSTIYMWILVLHCHKWIIIYVIFSCFFRFVI